MFIAGYTPAASIIAPQDLTICKKKDGSDFLLGQGTFGAVSGPLLIDLLTDEHRDEEGIGTHMTCSNGIA